MIQEKRKLNSRVARRRGAKIVEILDAAQGIVIREGIAALTIPALARELDAAVGGMYRYFENKQALVVALQVRAIERLDARMEEAIALVGGPGLQTVTTCAHCWREFGDDEPALFSLVDQMLSSPERLLDDAQAQQVQQALDRVLGRVERGLAVAQEEGVLSDGDPRLRTLVLWAALHGADHFRKRDARLAEAYHSGRVADAALADLLRGWGASPASMIFLE